MRYRRFSSVDKVIEVLNPSYPILCVHPDRLARSAQAFLTGFPGRVLYAVKCNPHPLVLEALWRAGIRHFDTASLNEIALVHELLPDAHCYFNHPVKGTAAIESADKVYNMDAWVVDTVDELDKIEEEVGKCPDIIQVRLQTASGYAAFDLSLKFGATRDEAVALLQDVERRGYVPAVSFHVGSQCRTPEAYARAIAEAGDVIERAGVKIRFLNVGGGFPAHYRGTQIPPLDSFFESIKHAVGKLSLPPDCELMCEPGRALVVEGCTILVQVHLRKGGSLYINDGTYGNLSELNIGKLTPPVRLIRKGGAPMSREFAPFRIFGPTCDSLDVLPEPFVLPDDVTDGDWIEIGQVGAYSNSVASHFNGFYTDTVVEIGDGPAHEGPSRLVSANP
ncbi:type III PLP-dependent enzyme [Zavarzinia sp.]|uniref:type III PLP-dependent enzyme n=1 Tax=Zavarzinia sp. TaxID=2027920 RepID=UPI0035686474